MNEQQMQCFLVTEEKNIVEVMTQIDKNAKGIAFVVDQEGRLLGCVTDGDIRRHLIATGNLKAEVGSIMNGSPICIQNPVLSTQSEQLLEQYKVIPVIDRDGRVEDILVYSNKKSGTNEAISDALSDVPVVIMAGGKGTRLYPYTKILPKPLIPIGEIPIVERILDRFHQYGAQEFYMTVNYKKGMIKSYFGEAEKDYSITYVEEDKPLGTGGSLKLIEKKFHKPLIVTNCDILIQADYADIYRYHLNSGNAITIVSALKNISVPYGVLNTAEDGVVLGMTEKPSLSYFVNTGMYVVNPEYIDWIPDNTFYHMTDLVDALLQAGKQVGMYPVSEDSFLDMGEFDEMRRMEEKLI